MREEPGRTAVSTEVIERIVLTANRAPSAENCQPWTFHWDGEALSIAHDDARARHVLNHRDDVSRIALGCVLEALDIAASAEGLRAETRLSLDGPSRGTWATLRFSPSETRARELLPAVLSRCTDRRLFRGGSLADPVFTEIRRDAERFPGAALHLLDRFSPELVRFITGADASIWRDPTAYRDVTRWVRFSQRELDEHGDGVPFASAGVHLPESQLFRLARSPLTRSIAEKFGLLTVARLWVERQLRSSAALVALTVRSSSREALVEAGRLGFSMWIRMNRAGYGVHPMTIQALPVYHAATAELRPGTPADLVALFRDGRSILERAFGYASSELPVWMFRTGRSPLPPPAQRTRRLPKERIFHREEPIR
jgi:hypothetical protein